MRRMVMIVAVALFLPLSGHCQSDEEIDNIAAFLGVTSVEELSDDEVERFADLMRQPLKINVASRSKLLSSGLFTSYQVASLMEYQKRTGMILSLSELAGVDGFGACYVQLLRPFVCVEVPMISDALAPSRRSVYQELSVRTGYRYVSQHQYQYGLKYSLDAGCGLGLALGFSRGLSAKKPYPSAYSISAVYDFKKVDSRLILGDFNARFGQGLLVWNGIFMNPLTSPSGFMKKASGLSPIRSFTGSSANTGVTAELNFGRFSLSAAASFPGLKDAFVIGKKLAASKLSLMPIANLRWSSRIGTVGVTSFIEHDLFNGCSLINAGSSVDAALCVAGVNMFAETAYDWVSRKFRFIAGTDFSPVEKLRIAALGSWNQGSQWQFAASGNFVTSSKMTHSITASSEFLYYLTPKDESESRSVQVKSHLYWEWTAHKHLIFRLKLADRFRTWRQNHRTELRTEFSMPFGAWIFDCRLFVLKCRHHALLGHADASYKVHPFNLHLRIGVFRVDHWDDRIYVYEYDAPGSFNVPSYYGRGVWGAAVLSCRIKRYMRLYFRASYIAYPFMSEQNKKPGRAELKIQSVFRF